MVPDTEKWSKKGSHGQPSLWLLLYECLEGRKWDIFIFVSLTPGMRLENGGKGRLAGCFSDSARWLSFCHSCHCPGPGSLWQS